MDIIDPLPLAPAKAQFVLFMTGYFSKWVEAQSYQKIREKEFIDFIWDHIVCRFRIPSKIACDNGKQFIGNKVTKFLEGLKIRRILSTPYHPSGNGQDESINKTIIQNLKKRLTNAKGKWREILPETSKSSTRASPLSLFYGTKDLIPVKVREPTIRFRYAMKKTNDEAMNTSKELLDERRKAPFVRLTAQKQRIERLSTRSGTEPLGLKARVALFFP
ncbi:uncharacterized protein [Nicotiana sylvestris]|uniref:uncharacterized protein n=1 Tax=Nicotiana sylvestris TaxID=4096 RepID=UPI00388C6F90